MTTKSPLTQSARDPWAHPDCSGDIVVTCDARDRAERIRTSSDVAWLRAVLAWPDNQIGVRLAAERRLRKLARGDRRR